MPKALQIANWSRYEKADSKKVTTMQWVAVPTNHSGLGYLEMVARPDGVRTIGGWLLILQVASQCPVRGLLVSDSGRILGARELSLKTRAREENITACIAVLLELGWLEEIEISGDHPDTVRTNSRLQGGTGQGGTRQDNNKTSTPPTPPTQSIEAKTNELISFSNSSNPPCPVPALPGKPSGKNPDAWWFDLRESERDWLTEAIQLDQKNGNNWRRDITAIQSMVEAFGFDRVIFAARSLVVHGKPPYATKVLVALRKTKVAV